MTGLEKRPLIIDTGSHSCKFGFAGNRAPSLTIPSIVGHTRSLTPHYYVGQEARSRRSTLSLDCPFEYGMVDNWDDMERIWRHAFHDKLQITPKQHPLLITEPPRNSKANREKASELAFETFACPAMNIVSQPLASLYASGRLSGIVLDSGHAVTRTVPIYEGNVKEYGILSLDLGGDDVTKRFNALLGLIGCSISHNYAWVIGPGLKEKLCYIAEDFENEMAIAATSTDLKMSCELPDGQLISVNNERFRATEMIFQPSFIGIEYMGVGQMVDYSISKCPTNIQKYLYSSVVLAGGNTMFQGFADRLKRELVESCNWLRNDNVVAPPNRAHSAWTGASMIASTSTFRQTVVTKQDYFEIGSNIVHSKRF